jgi:hypothetical protein
MREVNRGMSHAVPVSHCSECRVPTIALLGRPSDNIHILYHFDHIVFDPPGSWLEGVGTRAL